MKIITNYKLEVTADPTVKEEERMCTPLRLLNTEVQQDAPLEQISQDSAFDRDYKFQGIRRQIRPLFHILGKIPQTDLEKCLAGNPVQDKDAHTPFQVDDHALQKAEVNLFISYPSIMHCCVLCCNVLNSLNYMK